MAAHDYDDVIYLVGEYPDVFVERLGRTDVATGNAWFARCARRQLTLLEDQSKKRKQRMSAFEKHNVNN